MIGLFRRKKTDKIQDGGSGKGPQNFLECPYIYI